MRRGEFPTRENCDPTNPEEAFLWMFVALPGLQGAPLLMPPDYYRLVSKRLWDLGCRPVEAPTLEWVPPSATEPNWMTSPGHWVAAGTRDLSEEQQAKLALAKMSAQQRHELLQALEADELPDTPAGRVAETLTMLQRTTVLTLLRGWNGDSA